MTRFEAASIRATAALPYAAHTEPPPAATLPLGPPETPTGPERFSIVFVTWLNSGSIRANAPTAPSATQIAPVPAATPVGVKPSGIVLTTVRVRASIRDSVLSSWFATQTEPEPTVTPPGRMP